MYIDQTVFAEDHVPQNLPHRDQELQQLERAFAPATRGQRADDVLITGPSGVGKTVLARLLLERLEQRAAVQTVYLSCLGLTTRNVLAEIAAAVSGGVDGRMTVPNCLEAIQDGVTEPTIVVLDEADGLQAEELLETIVEVPLLSVVGVCHDREDWTADLGGWPLARFDGDQTVTLDRYGVDELADILAVRAMNGLPPRAFDDELLEDIADRAAGVARVGIQTLRAAAEVASKHDRQTITSNDVENGLERARQRIRRANLRSLPLHHRLLYSIVVDSGGIEAGELHERYERVAGRIYSGRTVTPIGRRARRNALAKLREYDLLECEGDGPHREYFPREESLVTKIRLAAEQ